MLMKIFDAARIATASAIIVGAVLGAVIATVVYGYNSYGWVGVVYAALAIFWVVTFIRVLIEKV